MKSCSRALVASLAVCLLASSPAGSAGQAGEGAGPPERGSVVQPLVFGGLAGLGLAVAYIAPDGHSWLVSDEVALPVAVAAGLATGLLVHVTSSPGGPGLGMGAAAGDRPHLRVAAGTGNGMDWGYSLAYRAPLRDGVEVEGALLVMSDSWERIERETRCSFLFGCVTGDFVTDHRYRQNVAVVARGIYHLRPGAVWRPTLALGGGPVLAHVEAYEASAVRSERSAGLLLDGGLAVERGTRTRWSAETGYRLVLTGSGSGPDPDAGAGTSGLYLRLGLGLAAGTRSDVGTTAADPGRGPAAAAPAAEPPATAARHSPDPLMWSLAATVFPILGGVLLVGAGVGDQSEVGTVLNSSFIWGGALIGPGAGYFRSGRTRRGLQSMAVRSAIFGVAWALAPTRDFDDGFLPNPSLDDMGVWTVATGAILISDLIDILSVRERPASRR